MLGKTKSIFFLNVKNNLIPIILSAFLLPTKLLFAFFSCYTFLQHFSAYFAFSIFNMTQTFVAKSPTCFVN